MASPFGAPRRVALIMVILSCCLPLLLSISALVQEAPSTVHSADGHSPLGRARAVEQLECGDLLVALASGEFLILDADSGGTKRTYGSFEEGTTFWLAPDERHLAIGKPGESLEVHAFRANVAGEDAVEPGVAVQVHRGDADSKSGWNRVAWAPDGESFVTWQCHWFHGIWDYPVEVWGLDGERIWRGPSAASDVALHPTEPRMAIVSMNEVQIGWPGDGFIEVDLPGAFGTIDYSPDGMRIAVGGTSAAVVAEEGTRWKRSTGDRFPMITLLNSESGKVIVRSELDAKCSMFNEWLQRVSWNPTGEYIGVSVGKGYTAGVLRVSDMTSGRVEFGGGQMWAILDGFWANDYLYRPCFMLSISDAHDRALFDARDPEKRVATPQKYWLQVADLAGTTDVVALHDDGVSRVTPSSMKVVWAR